MCKFESLNMAFPAEHKQRCCGARLLLALLLGARIICAKLEGSIWGLPGKHNTIGRLCDRVHLKLRIGIALRPIMNLAHADGQLCKAAQHTG
jgi:hypothetical protein